MPGALRLILLSALLALGLGTAATEGRSQPLPAGRASASRGIRPEIRSFPDPGLLHKPRGSCCSAPPGKKWFFSPRTSAEKPYGGSFWLFLFFSFVYGVIHALGPGHGKIFAASYFLNRPGGLGAGLLFGNLTMFVHVLSATTLVLAGYHLLHASAAMTVDVVGDRLETISFGLLLALGLALTAKSCLDLRTGHAHQREHSRQPSPKTDMRSLVGMSLAVGLIPCPGAALILIFSLSLGITIAGLLAMACISLGMGLTISAVALLVISSRGACPPPDPGPRPPLQNRPRPAFPYAAPWSSRCWGAYFFWASGGSSATIRRGEQDRPRPWPR